MYAFDADVNNAEVITGESLLLYSFSGFLDSHIFFFSIVCKVVSGKAGGWINATHSKIEDQWSF